MAHILVLPFECTDFQEMTLSRLRSYLTRLQYFTNSKFDFIVKELKFQLNNKKEHPDVCGASIVPLTLNYLFDVKNVKYIL